MRVPCKPHLVLCGGMDFEPPQIVESELLAAVALSFVGPGQDNWSLVGFGTGFLPVWLVFEPVRPGSEPVGSSTVAVEFVAGKDLWTWYVHLGVFHKGG